MELIMNFLIFQSIRGKGVNYSVRFIYRFAVGTWLTLFSLANGELIQPTFPTLPTASTITYGQSLSSSALTGGRSTSFSGGEVSTLAGTGEPGFSDGNASEAKFNGPTGLALDSSGNLYVADESNHRIRKINTEGTVTTLAGDGYGGSTDGPGSTARFYFPSALALDTSRNIYVADSINNRIRKITPSGQVSTLAGNGIGGLGDSSSGSTNVKFWQPNGVAVDSGGNVYVGDSYNNRLRYINRYGYVTTLAGSGPFGSYSTIKFADGDGSVAKFHSPQGVAVDSSGNVYIADRGNHRIRRYKSGVVSTLAGNGTPGFTNGTGSAAQFAWPDGLAVDAAGNVYVAEWCKIRKVTPQGVVTTLAGGDVKGFRNDSGTNALFDNPAGVAVDSSGDIYVADCNNHRIRKITFSIPGTWSWTDPAQVPGAGMRFLSAIFTPADRAKFSTYTTNIQILINPAPTRILVSPQAGSIDFGQALSNSVLSGGSAGVEGNFSWLSPNNRPPVGTSLQTVRFVPVESNNYSSSTTNISILVKNPAIAPVITSTNLWRGTVGVVFSNQLTANGSVPITFSASNPPTGLTLSTNGLILGNPTTAGTNMALITASNTVGVVRQTNTFIIAKGTPVISNWPSSLAITYGRDVDDSLLVGGSANVPGNFRWGGSNPRIAYSRVLPQVGTNSHVVTFWPQNTNNWNTVTTNISFVVNPAAPVLTWAPSPVAGLTYPSTLSSAQLNATSSVPGRFTYTPPVGTVLNPGTNTLVATFQPTDTANFLANRTITNTVVVAQGTPQVTNWPVASPISLGQTLSNSVLSGGVANVPGSFAWTSPAQQPSLGTNSHSVTFIPSATNNYHSITSNVSVVVALTSDTFPSSGQWTLRWNGSNAPSWYQPWMLSRSDGKYLAGMTVSDNGIQWRSMTNPTDVRFWINNTGYGNGTYLITGAANDLWNGTNERSWTKRGVPGSYDDLTQISYGNGVFVSRGYWSQGGVLVSSNNGNTWTYVNTGAFNYAPGTDSRHYCFLRYGNGKFFYPLFDSVRTSSNGLNWTTTSITNRPNAFRMSSSTCMDGGLFFGAQQTASNATTKTITTGFSSNGTQWSFNTATIATTHRGTFGITGAGGGYLMVYANQQPSELWVSSDRGLSWLPAYGPWDDLTNNLHAQFIADGTNIIAGITSGIYSAPLRAMGRGGLTMYGLDGQNRRLVQVDLSSGGVTKVADLPFTSGWSGFDYNPADGFLYAAVGGANRSNAIYKIDPRTGATQRTGSVVSPGGDGSFESIGFRNDGSLLAYDEHFDMPSGHLLSVNLAAGTSQILGSSRTPSCLGGDFDATRNTFWVSDEWNGKLYQLNPTNGSIVWTSTSTWYTGNGSGDMFDVDVAANGMVYVAVSDRGANKILRCDPSTGKWAEQCTVPMALRLASVPVGDTPLPQPPQ